MLEEVGRPSLAVGRRHAIGVQQVADALRLVDIGGESLFDAIGEQVFVVGRLAVASLMGIEILALHHLPPARTRSLIVSRTGAKS